ncbi:transposase [Variovorax sp. V15]|uniref:transposase n=1 Tax=Variovorax sp. V15 TaxID=3065952 RepID=UPI0034E8828D
MMGQNAVQDQLFYAFNLETHVPGDHLLRGVDRFLDLGELRQHLAPFYSHTGWPSIDPELMIRMLVIGYCLGIRSERRLCEEVHLNLAYRWFCRLGPSRKIARSIHEGAREVARFIAKTPEYKRSRRERKKVEMLFAHLKRIMKLDRLRLRGLSGAQDEFLLGATAQNLRRMAKWLMPGAADTAMKNA